MTEEFTAVYRMHSLLPDDFSFRRHSDDDEVVRAISRPSPAAEVRELYAKVPFDDVLYSLATSHPGALVLHNYPNGPAQAPAEKDAIFIDLAAIDVLRDRERGVPRYCAFRRHLGMRVPKSFAELTSNRIGSVSSRPSTISRAGRSPGRPACETAPPGSASPTPRSASSS